MCILALRFLPREAGIYSLFYSCFACVELVLTFPLRQSRRHTAALASSKASGEL